RGAGRQARGRRAGRGRPPQGRIRGRLERRPRGADPPAAHRLETSAPVTARARITAAQASSPLGDADKPEERAAFLPCRAVAASPRWAFVPGAVMAAWQVVRNFMQHGDEEGLCKELELTHSQAR